MSKHLQAVPPAGTVFSMSQLMALIQDHLDRYGVSRAEFARRAGTTPQTVNNWRHGLRQLPEAAHLQGVAEVIGVPYLVVLNAALVDAGYRDSMVDDVPALRAGLTRLAEADPAALDEVARIVDRLRAEQALARADESAPAASDLDESQSRAVAEFIGRILRRELEGDGGDNGGQQSSRP